MGCLSGVALLVGERLFMERRAGLVRPLRLLAPFLVAGSQLRRAGAAAVFGGNHTSVDQDHDSHAPRRRHRGGVGA